MSAPALRLSRTDLTTTLIALAGLTLAACASSGSDRQLLGQVADSGTKGAPTQKYTGYRVGKPYQVKGVWYYPKDQPRYDEIGTASWYGEQFHNKYTADGEMFDMNMPSAAHKTLPLPSLVEVTNLSNGKTVILRVNDRGPFVDGRIIDLSKAAAGELGMIGAGVAKVRVRYVGRALDPPGWKTTPDWLNNVTRQQQAAAAPPPLPQPVAKPQAFAANEMPPPPVAQPAPVRASAPANNGPALPDVDALFAKPATAVAHAAASYEMQAGSFPTFDGAQRFALSLTGSGLPEVQTVNQGAGQVAYQVVVHGLASPADAAAASREAMSLGANKAVILAGS